MDTNLDDNFMDAVSAHGGLIHAFFKVHTVTSKGITTLINNSPDLITLKVSAYEVIEFDVELDLNLLAEKFSHRKLFIFGMFSLLPLNVEPDDLLRNTDLLPLWPLSF